MIIKEIFDNNGNYIEKIEPSQTHKFRLRNPQTTSTDLFRFIAKQNPLFLSYLNRISE